MKASIVEMEGLLRGKCVPAKMLVNESLAEYLVRQFDALHQRADKAERDELRAIAEEQSKLAGSNAAKAQKAEEELARRDAAASEPDGYIFCHPSGKNFWSVSHDDTAGHNGVKPFYFAAQPAMVPPAISTEGLDPESKDIDEVRNLAHIVGANWMREQAMALGAQQQKVVELPDPADDSLMSTWQFNDAVINALDAAGVKWEVKK